MPPALLRTGQVGDLCVDWRRLCDQLLHPVGEELDDDRSEADYRAEQEACGEHVTSTERWAPKGGSGCLKCLRAYLIDLGSTGIQQT